MAFLRKKDYYAALKEDELNVIIETTESFRQEKEKAAQERISFYIRHHYDVDQIFKDINAFNISTQYDIGDLIEWTETAYDESSTYNTGDRVSYQNNIYSANSDGLTGTFTPASWTLLAENESLYYCGIKSLGNLPTNTFSYTESTKSLTGNYDQIKGWDRENKTLYFKRIENEVKIYYSTSDRDSNINHVGLFEYPYSGIEFPTTIEIKKGASNYDFLNGFINIEGFIDNDQEWDVSANNYWIVGDNRNPLIVELMLDITIYSLLSRIQPRNIQEHRIERYNGNIPEETGGAIGLLKQIAKGNGTLNIPTHFNKNRGTPFAWGSKTKKKYEY